MKENRSLKIRAVDPAGANGQLILEGNPIVFNQVASIDDGRYQEIIHEGALDNADLSDIRLLYNHDLQRIPMARTPKTMQFEKSPAGLTMKALLPDTEQGRALYTAVQRGDLSQMSFAFTVPAGGDYFDIATNTRHITAIKKVYEFSVVPFAAYPQTSVEARTAIDEKRKAKVMINQIMKRGI